MRLIIFSLVLVSCAGVPRPDTNLYVANAPAKHLKGYNLLKDYDDEGLRNPSAKAIFLPLNSINDINKFTCTDPDGLANLKAYLRKLRSEAKIRCQ